MVIGQNGTWLIQCLPNVTLFKKMQNSHENIKNQNRENARATSTLFMKYLTMSRSHI
jgi:hypothetical protein